MQKPLPFLIFIATLSLVGCATTDDLKRLRGDLNQQIQLTNERIATVETGSVALKGEITGVRKDIEKVDEKSSETFRSIRSSQAEVRADMTEMRDQIQQIRGTLDGLRKDLSTVAVKTNRREEEDKALSIKEKLENLNFKINFIENFLGIGKKEEEAEAAVEKNGKTTAVPAPRDTAGKAKTDKESLYAAAYELFREAKYDKSREAFENFLKQYPDTEFSDNAQFWIGECYYFEKKYEKAIVEYEKVTKNFPEGNKLPYALLKQGLSFLKLGDKASGKLLLQQVIKDFPNTSQARIARAKLLEIK